MGEKQGIRIWRSRSREIVDFEVFKSDSSIIFQDTWVEHVDEHVLKVLLFGKHRPKAHPSFCIECNGVGLETELDQVFEEAERASAFSGLWDVVVIAALGDWLDVGIGRKESEIAVAVQAEKCRLSLFL